MRGEELASLSRAELVEQFRRPSSTFAALILTIDEDGPIPPAILTSQLEQLSRTFDLIEKLTPGA